MSLEGVCELSRPLCTWSGAQHRRPVDGWPCFLYRGTFADLDKFQVTAWTSVECPRHHCLPSCPEQAHPGAPPLHGVPCSAFLCLGRLQSQGGGLCTCPQLCSDSGTAAFSVLGAAGRLWRQGWVCVTDAGTGPPALGLQASSRFLPVTAPQSATLRSQRLVAKWFARPQSGPTCVFVLRRLLKPQGSSKAFNESFR